jgi:hypothetical protein
LAGVVLLAIGYGFWEWRADIIKIINKLKEKISG